MATRRHTGQTDEVDRIIEEWANERRDIDAGTIGVFGRLSRLQPLQRQATAELHRRHGLNVAAFDVLASLRRSGEPYRKTIGELAESSLLTPAAVSLRIDNLERAGLVRRVRSPEDRRQVFAQLTSEGKHRIDAIFEEHIALEARMLAGFSQRERTVLADLLRRLHEAVREVAGGQE